MPANYLPRRDERLSWPGWLTCSGWLTNICGHPSAAGRAQDRESLPTKTDVLTTEPGHQPSAISAISPTDAMFLRTDWRRRSLG